MTAYTQRRHLKYTAPQLFDLVADVERYPQFLPWVTEARIRYRQDHTILVDMTMRLGPLRKRFSTVGLLHRPNRIDISSYDPLFDRFENGGLSSRSPTAVRMSNITSISSFDRACCKC